MDAVRPRFFWRRALATLIDVFVCMQISFMLAVPFVGNGDHFRFSGQFGLVTSQCRQIAAVPPEFKNFVGVARQKAALMCQLKVNGFDNGYELTVMTRDVDPSGMMITRKVTTAANAAREIVFPLNLQDLIYAVILVGGGSLFLKRWQRTPGKWLLGLRVENVTRPIRREVLKYAVTVIAAAFGIIVSLMDAKMIFVTLVAGLSSPSVLVILVIVGIALAILFFAYYVLPLIRWRGQMIWDQWSGSWVERV